MKFIFDCEDEICLPLAYKLVDEVKPYIDKVKKIEVEENSDRKEVMRKILENAMVKYPKDTSKVFAKLWVLDKGEKAPNVFKTTSALFSNEVAVDFFTSVLPSLVQISKGI